MSQISILNFFTQYFAKLKIGIWQFFFEETTKLEKKSEGKPPLCTLNFLVVFPNIPTIPLMFSRISVKVTSKAYLKTGDLKSTQIENDFCLVKSSKILFTFLPAFYLVIWLMTSPKCF